MDATIHQRVGEADVDTLFQTLRGVDFFNRIWKVGGESIIASSLSGYPEKMKI